MFDLRYYKDNRCNIEPIGLLQLIFLLLLLLLLNEYKKINTFGRYYLTTNRF